MDHYEKSAIQYESVVFEEIKVQLEIDLDRDLFKCFEIQVKQLVNKADDLFSSMMKRHFSGEAVTSNFVSKSQEF